MKLQNIYQRANEVLKQFPVSRNGVPYMTLENGRKVFLGRFIKKYGLDGSFVEYSDIDLRRRIPMVEFFDFFMNLNIAPGRVRNRFLLESKFFRMVILECRNKSGHSTYHLISFYPL